MDKYIEKHYRAYQKNADPLVLKSYYELVKKSENKELDKNELLDVTHRLEGIKIVIQERNLYIKKPTPPSAKTTIKENTNNAFKDGGKAFLIGVFLFALGLILMNKFDGNKYFLIITIIGAFKILEGIITVAVGFFYNVTR